MSSIIPFDTKLTDYGRVPFGGQADDYWVGQILKHVFKGSRKKEPPKGFEFWNPEYVCRTFGLRGLEFGNWLSQEDRYIYLAGAAYAMRDYCQVMKIKPELYGIANRITLAFGARGRSAALAHFEPDTFAINLTRYRRAYVELELQKFFTPSGAGSLGHEHAHALDFYAGYIMDKNGDYLFATDVITGRFQYAGISNKTSRQLFRILSIPKNKTQKAAFDLMSNLLYEKAELRKLEGGKQEQLYAPKKWYVELKEYISSQEGLGDYWTSYIEIFARSTEVYLFHKCNKAGIQESYLKKKKYTGAIYPTIEVIKEVEPYFDAFFKHIYDHIAKNS